MNYQLLNLYFRYSAHADYKRFKLISYINMQKNCSKSQCPERVAYACNCTNPESYFCDVHFSQHTRTPGRHINECLLLTLDEDQKIELLPKLLQITQHLKVLEENIMKNTSALITSIQAEACKSVKKIVEFQRIVNDLITDKGIETNDYTLITEFKFENNNPVTVDDMNTITQSLFEARNRQVNAWKECNQVIFSRDETEGKVVSVDLTSFQLLFNYYIPGIGTGGQACKIDANTFFFHGGYLGGRYRGEAYLINTKQQTCQSVTTGPVKRFAASVLKDNKVYIFGGHNGGYLNTSSTYDLLLKEWKSISPLPLDCICMTAALIGKDIILSGLQMGCCYAYNDLLFTSVVELPMGKQKIVCEGWIFCDSILYENRDENVSRWTRHNVNYPWNNLLFIQTTFKKGKFIYFIENTSCLIRIDTESKKLERCEFG